MNRIKGLLLGLGVATLIVAGLACGAEERQDTTEAGAASDAPQAQDQPEPNLTHGSPPPPAPSGAPLHGDPGPSLTHGSPQPPAASSPEPSLKFGDLNYVHGGSTELPTGEGTGFVIHGTEISMDDLEVVGNTSIPDEQRAVPRSPAPGVCSTAQSLTVYRLKGAGTNELYTFRPGKDHVNPEDGQIFKGQDVWTRWTTR